MECELGSCAKRPGSDPRKVIKNRTPTKALSIPYWNRRCSPKIRHHFYIRSPHPTPHTHTHTHRSQGRECISLRPHSTLLATCNLGKGSFRTQLKSEEACNAGDLGSAPGLGRSPGEGHGNPFQYSCLENLHEQRSLVGCSPLGCKELDMAE